VADYVEVNVKGGLGNQIFGLAAGWAIASELKSSLLVNGTDIGWRGSNRSRSLELDLIDWQGFSHELKFSQTKKVPDLGALGNRFSTRILERNLQISRNLEQRDSPQEFDLLVESAGAGQVLDGNYINFEWLNRALKYSFPSRFRLKNMQPVQSVKLSETAIHIRLGDFLKYPALFPIPTQNYYINALEHLCSSKFDVYTDDLDSAIQFYPDLLKRAVRVIGPDDYSGPETFTLLGQYSRIVTSASTFSSIAAWSVGINGGQVICPEKMLVSETFDSRPKGWIRVGD
jgi:hypothetical protein